VCYHNNHPKASQQQIADHFSTLWSSDAKHRTVDDILNQRDKWQNVSGSHKLRPLVIGVAFNHKLYVNYAYNNKSWMTGSMFRDWLSKFYRKMERTAKHFVHDGQCPKPHRS